MKLINLKKIDLSKIIITNLNGLNTFRSIHTNLVTVNLKFANLFSFWNIKKSNFSCFLLYYFKWKIVDALLVLLLITCTNYFNLCSNKYYLGQAFVRGEVRRICSIRIVNCHQIFVKLVPYILQFYFNFILSFPLQNPKSDRIENNIYKPSFIP